MLLHTLKFALLSSSFDYVASAKQSEAGNFYDISPEK